MEYYTAIRKNDLRKCTYIWINMESVVLSEMSQRDSDRHRMIAVLRKKSNSSLLWNIKNTVVIIFKEKRNESQEVWSMVGSLPQRSG